MSKLNKKEKSVRRIAIETVIQACRESGNLVPLTWLLGRRFRYGTRKQITGTLFDYVRYCKKTHKAIQYNGAL